MKIFKSEDTSRDQEKKNKTAKFIEAAERASIDMDWPPKPLTREDLQKTFDMIKEWKP